MQSTVAKAINYVAPEVPDALPWVESPLVEATRQSLAGYGTLVDDYHDFDVKIVTWPAFGWRQVDAGTGNEAGTVHGIFEAWWAGDALWGHNGAVDDRYLFGWSKNPGDAIIDGPPCSSPTRLLLWHANYHPDGGQLFYPLDGTPFVTALALPGDDVRPELFTTFYFDGTQGLYIHPGVWHEGIFPLAPRARFYDEQGRVHARISCNFADEFRVFLSVPLPQHQGPIA
jgi:hypothetical protein